MNKKVLVLPGDGIGREVCDAALPVLSALNLPITLTYGDIGWNCWESEGNPVPELTWNKIKNADAVLLGAITSKGKLEAEKALPPHLQGKNHQYISPVIQLRQRLELFVNIRPAYYIEGVARPFDLCVMRENTEGLYSGFDFKGIPESASTWLTHPNIEQYGPDEAAWSVRLQTRFGLERLFRAAFEYAAQHNMKRVTFADKPNVMRESGHFAKTIFDSIAAAYPEIKADIHNVDAVALWLVKKPNEFGVIVAENMFGDILSDLAAGVMGGLGLAPSANIGKDIAYFEPVHGSAPNMAGQNKANPSAMFLSIALMLEYLGFSRQAENIRSAVSVVIRQGKKLTYDLGGNATTHEMAGAIIDAVGQSSFPLSASVVTIGDELLSGKCLNSNLHEISKRLNQAGYQVSEHSVCGDDNKNIKQALVRRLGQDDLIVVCGGLGPTSDDKTRFTVADATSTELEFCETTWDSVQDRLKKFGVSVDPSNRIQAYFPEGATILPNRCGTAAGFSMAAEGTDIIVLPGPPGEAIPMLDIALPKYSVTSLHCNTYHWLLLGISESEVGTHIKSLTHGLDCDVHYLWQYPYVSVEITTPLDAPLPEKTIDAINQHFSYFLVSRNNKPASSNLGDSCHVRWVSTDQAIQTMCRQWARCSSDTDAIEVQIQTEPGLDVIEKTEAYQGSIHLSCLVNSTHKWTIDFPCRGPEICQFISEFAAWSVLRSLKVEKGNNNVEQ